MARLEPRGKLVHRLVDANPGHSAEELKWINCGQDSLDKIEIVKRLVDLLRAKLVERYRLDTGEKKQVKNKKDRNTWRYKAQPWSDEKWKHRNDKVVRKEDVVKEACGLLAEIVGKLRYDPVPDPRYRSVVERSMLFLTTHKHTVKKPVEDVDDEHATLWDAIAGREIPTRKDRKQRVSDGDEFGGGEYPCADEDS